MTGSSSRADHPKVLANPKAERTRSFISRLLDDKGER